MASKRRSNKINLLSLSFVSKCISKAFLIKILQIVVRNIDKNIKVRQGIKCPGDLKDI